LDNIGLGRLSRSFDNDNLASLLLPEMLGDKIIGIYVSRKETDRTERGQ
jgi:hypothetical protein